MKKLGRPTDYRESFCEKVIELATATDDHLPCSYTQIAVELGIIRNTLYVWSRRYPNFKYAILRARELHQKWFEQELQKGFWDTTEREVANNRTTTSTKRLNSNAVKLYAFMNFGISERRVDGKEQLDISDEFYDKKTTLERKHAILDESLIAGKIAASQHQILNNALNSREEENVDRDINITLKINKPEAIQIEQE